MLSWRKQREGRQRVAEQHGVRPRVAHQRRPLRQGELLASLCGGVQRETEAGREELSALCSVHERLVVHHAAAQLRQGGKAGDAVARAPRGAPAAPHLIRIAVEGEDGGRRHAGVESGEDTGEALEVERALGRLLLLLRCAARAARAPRPTHWASQPNTGRRTERIERGVEHESGGGAPLGLLLPVLVEDEGEEHVEVRAAARTLRAARSPHDSIGDSAVRAYPGVDHRLEHGGALSLRGPRQHAAHRASSVLQHEPHEEGDRFTRRHLCLGAGNVCGQRVLTLLQPRRAATARRLSRRSKRPMRVVVPVPVAVDEGVVEVVVAVDANGDAELHCRPCRGADGGPCVDQERGRILAHLFVQEREEEAGFGHASSAHFVLVLVCPGRLERPRGGHGSAVVAFWRQCAAHTLGLPAGEVAAAVVERPALLVGTRVQRLPRCTCGALGEHAMRRRKPRVHKLGESDAEPPRVDRRRVLVGVGGQDGANAGQHPPRAPLRLKSLKVGEKGAVGSAHGPAPRLPRGEAVLRPRHFAHARHTVQLASAADAEIVPAAAAGTVAGGGGGGNAADWPAGAGG